MCRIFGFRSILQSGVHKSLLDAENSIIKQSVRHPDGWGVAYYKMGCPHLIKLDQQAKDCKIFAKVSGVVSSNTILAHIRKSTVGKNGPLNTHPFQYGSWTFAHNGNIENFEKLKNSFLQKINPELRPFILGETDSEHLFYLLLTVLQKHDLLNSKDDADVFSDVLKEYLKEVTSLSGSLQESKGDYDKNYLTFVLTNGQTMIAFNGGQNIFYSTHKKLCSERKICPHLALACEKEANLNEKVHHFIVSSELIKNENVWLDVNFGEAVWINEEFQFKKKQIV